MRLTEDSRRLLEIVCGGQRRCPIICVFLVEKRRLSESTDSLGTKVLM